MIRYDLVCDQGHGFDGWFAGSDAFDTQAKRGFVTCAVCGSLKVTRAIMAPAVKRTDRSSRSKPPLLADDQTTASPSSTAALMSEDDVKTRELLARLHDHVVANTEDVGERFAEEARAIHDGASEERAIRGRGSPEDIRALHEDGIAVLPLPPRPDRAH